MAYRKGTDIVGFTPSFFPFVGMFQLIMIAVRLVNWLFYRTRIRGRANLEKTAGAILVSNHTMLLDPAVIAHALGRRRTYFTMLEETALIPYLGTFVRLLGALPIPEGAGSLLSLEGGARRAIAELGFLHFFPEGECYRWNQEIQPFRPGAFLLACRLGLPVIPMTTVLRERRWRGCTSIRVLGRTMPLPPVVTVIIGSPVRPLLPSSGSEPELHAIRGAALQLAVQTREEMQHAIDAMGGSRTIYRGKMPRLVKKSRAAEPPGFGEPAVRHSAHAG
jgi:1-acyl-sn-glycerol-3-phosphate acyltransferase